MNISARIHWNRGDANFADKRYSRSHTWRLDGGLEIPASSSPHVVPIPLSNPAAIDPEEAFVASLSSCHMLWFLAIAAKRGFVVDEYVDDAIGDLARDADGKMAMTTVTLRPAVRWSGATRPTEAHLREMHELAHAECFIARSVKTRVAVEPAAEATDARGR